MDIYTHVIPGMDEAAANMAAALILAAPETDAGDADAAGEGVVHKEGVVHRLVHNELGDDPEKASAAAIAAADISLDVVVSGPPLASARYRTPLVRGQRQQPDRPVDGDQARGEPFA